METMRFRETKKNSYKGHIAAITLFLLLGAGVIAFAISSEKEPEIVGNIKSDIEVSKSLEEIVVDIYKAEKQLYAVDNKIVTDKTNVKIKADITLPVVTINDEIATKINDEIYSRFTTSYYTLKETMKNAENNFTYTTSFKFYENIVDNNKILSLRIYERIIDDAATKTAKTPITSMDKISTYNINLEDSSIVKQNEITIEILGPTYKDIIKTRIKEELLKSSKTIKEDNYNYTYTEQETFYIKDGKFHLIFNPGEGIFIDEKDVLDITI